MSAGVQMSQEETSGVYDWDTFQWGISFNVSDNIALGYGQRTVDRTDTNIDQEDSGFSASYTMGSMSITGNLNKSDDMHGSSGSDKETTEIAVSFAF